MIFTASDVSSLTGWEWGEYISEAFVIVGCAGELIADFGRKCLTKAHRDRVERLSTILLVAALSASLTCLVRTNELSGNVIGSLGAKADEADEKAKTAITDSSTALSQAKDALTKAGKAQDSFGRTEDEANKAQAASFSALTLASGARKEADSFEADIKSAKQQAAEAEAHLAEAKKQAVAAEDEAKKAQVVASDALSLSRQTLTNEENIEWRRLTDDQIADIGKELRQFAGQQAYLEYSPDDLEGSRFAKDIESALIQGRWLIAGIGTPNIIYGAGKIFPASPDSVPPVVPPVPTGVQITINPDIVSRNAAGVLSQELINRGFDASPPSVDSRAFMQPGQQQGFPIVFVKVGHRPQGPQGAAKLRQDRQAQKQ
jgi:hypothetical protein